MASPQFSRTGPVVQVLAVRAFSDRETTRDRILDSMGVVLARLGYDGLTLEEVAEETGVSEWTIRFLFRNKEELVLAHFDRLAERVLEQVRCVASRSGPAMVRLQNALLARVMCWHECIRLHPEAFQEVLAALRPAYLSRRQAHFEAQAEAIARIVREAQEVGSIRADLDTRTASRTLIAATNAMLPSCLTTRELNDQAAVEAKAREVIQLLMAGLMPPAFGIAYGAVRDDQELKNNRLRRRSR